MKISILLFFIFSFLVISCGEDDIVKNNEKPKFTLSYNVSYNGNSEIKQIRAALFDYEISVTDDIPSGPPSSTAVYPQEPSSSAIDFSDTYKLTLEAVKDKKYLVVIYGDVNTQDGKFSVNNIDPVYIQTDFIPTKNETFDITLQNQQDDCIPQCDNKICGDNGCGGTCGSCEENTVCSQDGTACLETEKTYEIKVKLTYNGNKSVKRIGIAGYYDNSYSGMPKYVKFIKDGDLISFPYEFSFNPTEDSDLNNIPSDYSGDFYVWLYGDTDGVGFQATDTDPQAKFNLILPKNDEVLDIELKDIE